MGFTPAQVDEMSLWEWAACVTGYAKAKGAKTISGTAEVDDATLREMGIAGF